MIQKSEITPPTFEIQMNTLLKNLDRLIEVIQNPNESGETVETIVNPDADFEPTPPNQVDYVAETKDFLIALNNVKFPGGAIQYARITQRVFTDTLWFDAVENIVEKIKESIEQNFLYMLQEEKELSRKCYKLLDHLLLASYQLGEITKHTRDQTQNLQAELKTSEEKFNNKSKELNRMQKGIQKELTKIYVQFVTILSIFTAVVVSIFGGLSMISTSFANLKELKLWEVTLTISLFAIAVLCMLSLLTGWISTIVLKLYDKAYKHSFKNYIIHNGAFATGIFIFSYIAILSAVFNSSSFRKTILDFVDVGGSIPIVIVFSLPLLAGALIFIKSIDYRTFKKDQDN